MLDFLLRQIQFLSTNWKGKISLAIFMPEAGFSSMNIHFYGSMPCLEIANDLPLHMVPNLKSSHQSPESFASSCSFGMQYGHSVESKYRSSTIMGL